jgi:dTMP kinase
MPRGLFFSFDGLDGVGKSTQRGLFIDWLRERGHEVVSCIDPGTTALGELLRKILLSDRQTATARRRSAGAARCCCSWRRERSLLRK